jgi:hypothetical protein
MEIETRQHARKTPEAVEALAGVVGVMGLVLFAFFAVAVVVNSSFSIEALFGAVALMLMGGASAVSLVGLCALFCGSELGGRFAVPLAVSFGGWFSPIVGCLMASAGVKINVELMFVIWVGGTISGVVVGWLLGRVIGGFGRRSRLLGAGGAIPMLLLGGWLMMTNGGLGDNILADPLAVFIFVIVLCACAMLGGVPGVLIGAVIDKLKAGS